MGFVNLIMIGKIYKILTNQLPLMLSQTPSFVQQRGDWWNAANHNQAHKNKIKILTSSRKILGSSPYAQRQLSDLCQSGYCQSAHFYFIFCQYDFATLLTPALKLANFLQPQTENSKTQLTPAVRSRHYLAQQRPLALKFFQDHHRDCNHCVVLRPNGSN